MPPPSEVVCSTEEPPHSPIRPTPLGGCCLRAESGQVIVAPPRRVIAPSHGGRSLKAQDHAEPMLSYTTYAMAVLSIGTASDGATSGFFQPKTNSQRPRQVVCKLFYDLLAVDEACLLPTWVIHVDIACPPSRPLSPTPHIATSDRDPCACRLPASDLQTTGTNAAAPASWLRWI